MDWERLDQIANRAQIPLTVSGYIAWAYVLWPKGAVLFGRPSKVSGMAVVAIVILCLGALSAASQLGLLHSRQAPVDRAAKSAAPVEVETGRDHSLIDISPFDLLAFFDQHLSPQALKLLEPYLGKRLRVTATVFDASVYDDGRIHVYGTIPSPSDPKSIGISVNYYFAKNWGDRVLIHKRGKPITAIGEIWKVDSKTIFLTHCELVGNV